MTPTQEDTSLTNLLQKEISDAVFQETLEKNLDSDENDKSNKEEEAEQVNGFELFMQNSKGNFSKLIGCGG
ncbi:MAG: hypothetical protein OHK0057_25780 [Thermoflexibacter sp.]